MASAKRRAESSNPRTFVVNSLGAKAQSIAEIERKLAARNVPQDEARAAVEEAVRLGYLDDAELARQLARGFLARRYGRRRAAQALRRRGVPEPVAEIALEEAYFGADEAELARKALGARPAGTDAERRRAVAYLVRRGFSPSAAWGVVRHPPAP